MSLPGFRNTVIYADVLFSRTLGTKCFEYISATVVVVLVRS